MALPTATVARLRVQIPGRRGQVLVTVDDEGRWRSSTRAAQAFLNEHEGGPGLLAMPGRVAGETAHALARLVIAKYGGRLLTKAPPIPEPTPGGGSGRIEDAEPDEVVY